MAAAATKYEELDPRNELVFDPASDIVTEKEYDTILVLVPGFKKGQLRVQLITSTNRIRVSGARETEAGKILRFQKEFSFDPKVDTNQISARFEKDTLQIKLPKKADQQQEIAKTANSESNLGKESDQVSGQKKLNEDAGKTNGDEVPAATTVASSEISRPRLSRKALYAVVVGLVAVVVGVGLYFTDVREISDLI